MSLRSYLRDRGLPVAIVVMAIAMGSAQMLYWWLAPAPKVNEFVGPPRSGYTLTNFQLWSYDVDGLPSFQMVAPHLERRENDDSLYINTPDFTLPSNQAGVPPWLGNSLYAWVDKSGTLLKLQGPVYMHRAAYCVTAAAEIHTSDVTAWPKENRMVTDAPAQMVQGDSKLSGVGMRANLNTNHLELLDESHGTFPPRKNKSQVGAKPACAEPAHAAAGSGARQEV
ncbi:LPS export ABC transporter periplasmic protein LptC [Dyella telluris]|uniref:LPS export ABC transporter periplasmic protein LptC n=1 Tax=Dyella telluris TaxID=2763498 RepID=A0A7G8Q0G3_9GAMM|nr:LPS export ABC transporter periplasmic protein LptC [Dyella telluris]QNK00271.1 LPS export ABC transporter periplasmic protein LptC [Dyella telluris]